jgi:transcriptional regulator with XRE-family HTH domain
MVKLGNLRKLRDGAFLTQKELAQISSVGVMTIIRAEQGSEVRPESARKLAAALGSTPKELIGAE